MKIFITLPNDDSCLALDQEPSASIITLKRAIQAKLDNNQNPANILTLVYHRQVLQNDMTLGSYGVTEGDSIHLHYQYFNREVSQIR